MPTIFEKYLTERRRGDGHGDVEEEYHQSYRRPYMTGKSMGKKKNIVRTRLSDQNNIMVVALYVCFPIQTTVSNKKGGV